MPTSREVAGHPSSPPAGDGRWRYFTLWAAIGLVGAFTFSVLFGAATYPIGPFSVRVAPVLAIGQTRLTLPPLGAITARTHDTPLSFDIELRTVDLDALQELAAAVDTTETAVEGLRTELIAALRQFVLRLLVLSVLGAALSAFLIQRDDRRSRAVLVATGTAILTTAILIGATWRTFDLDAFSEPDYSGVLVGAPWMIDLAERALSEADRLGDRLTAIAGGLEGIFSRVEQWEPVSPRAGERLILLVSDVHTNPAGLELVQSVAGSFNVDFVIDAGDLTDWGTTFEARLLRDIGRIPVPYVLIPGNHDSLQFLAQMEALANVQVLWLGEIEVAGVRIAGVADPSAYRSSPTVALSSELRATAGELSTLVDGLPAPPDIIVAHHPNVIAAIGEKAPLLISGHTHRPWIRRLGNSVWLNPGTTGAAGIRGLMGDGDVPYTLMLVHLNRDEQGRWLPIAVDQVQVSNFRTGFALERHVLLSTRVMQ